MALVSGTTGLRRQSLELIEVDDWGELQPGHFEVIGGAAYQAAVPAASVEAEGGMNDAHLANRFFADQLQQLRRLRMAAIHERFHQQHIIGNRRLGHGHCFGEIQGEGLFNKHVLLRFTGADRPFAIRP